jgi:hypothetical protein
MSADNRLDIDLLVAAGDESSDKADPIHHAAHGDLGY